MSCAGSRFMDTRMTSGDVSGEEIIEEFLHWVTETEETGEERELQINLAAGIYMRDEIMRLREIEALI